MTDEVIETQENSTVEQEADPTPAQEVVDNSGNPTDPQESATDDPQNTDGDSGTEPSGNNGSKKESGAEKRIKTLVGRAKQAEQERDYYRSLAEQGQRQSTQQIQQDQGLKAPNLDDYEDWQSFQNAQNKYLIEVAKAEFREESKLQSQQASVYSAKQNFSQKVAELYENDPEKFYKLDAVQLADRRDILDEIATSEDGLKIMEFLSDNPAEVRRLKTLGGSAMYREIGKIEARLSTPAPIKQTKKISTAPDPITPVATSGSGAIKKSPAEMSQKEYNDFMNKRLYGG